MTRVRVPCSTSNLGPGFDVLSLAFDLYIEIEATPAESFTVDATGEGADYPVNSSHLAARVAREAVGHDNFHFEITSQIPVGRGLGSSAAMAVAVAAAVGAEDPFRVAVGFDGHAENAAASVFGGLNAASMVDGEPIAMKLPIDFGLGFVVLIPDRSLSTEKARAALPKQIAFSDGVSNLGRMGLLLAGLSDREQLIAAAGVDRLHQDARASLFPEAPALLERLRAGGATVSCWSGAGPTLLGICKDADSVALVRDAGEVALRECGVDGRALVVSPDFVGLEYLS